MLRSPLFRVMLLCCCMATLVLSGCGDSIKDSGQEADLISEESSKKTELPKGNGPLWPLSPGKTWRTLTIRPNQKNVDSEIRVVGTFRLPDGRVGTLVRSSRAGKTFRVEVFRNEAGGKMNLLALGESESKLLVFTPAIPFLHMPPKEGAYEQWVGEARIGKQVFGATAFHRISAIDTIKTPFESMRTYRLDGIISLANAGQRIDYPAVMWFVPGKGVAQRRLADRGALAVEVITKFSD